MASVLNPFISVLSAETDVGKNVDLIHLDIPSILCNCSYMKKVEDFANDFDINKIWLCSN